MSLAVPVNATRFVEKLIAQWTKEVSIAVETRLRSGGAGLDFLKYLVKFN